MEAKTAHFPPPSKIREILKIRDMKELLSFDCETLFIHKGLNNAAPVCVNSGREVCTQTGNVIWATVRPVLLPFCSLPVDSHFVFGWAFAHAPSFARGRPFSPPPNPPFFP